MKRNLAILSGGAGKATLALYSRFFHYDAEVWLDWRLGVSKKYECSLNMICVMQDIAYRLVHKYDQPKFDIFEVCSVPEDAAFDLASVRGIASSLRAKSDACAHCVDKVFTRIWMWRLENMGCVGCRRAHTSLCDILALLRVTSTLVEKKHLLGQELKPAKRGRAVECNQLGRLVLRKSMLRAGELHRAEATLQCLGTDPIFIRQFKQSLSDCLATKHRDRRTEAQAATVGRAGGVVRKIQKSNSLRIHSLVKKRPLRGYDIFARTNFHSGLPAETTFGKRKLLNGKWNALTKEQKAPYVAAAEETNDQDQRNDGEDYVQFLQRHKATTESRAAKKRTRYKSDRLRAVLKTIDKLINHDVFRSGSRMHDFANGFRPDLVCIEAARDAVVTEWDRIFQYRIPAVP
jgi:hypothetical protein